MKEIFDYSDILPDGTCVDGIMPNSPLLKKQQAQEATEKIVKDDIEGNKDVPPPQQVQQPI